jgi:hypothetical protein
MPERQPDLRRQPRRGQASPALLSRSSNPVHLLQRSIGNRAVGQVLARDPDPVRRGSVKIPGVAEVKVKGGNLEEWAGTATLNWVEVTSKKGKHSAKLKKLLADRTKQDIKVTIEPTQKAGENLSVGSAIVLDVKDARITEYSVDEGGVETWRIGSFQNLKRTKITHTIGSN